MIKRRKWPVFWLILLGLNLAFIWGNSLMPREMSSALSKLVGRVLSALLPSSGDLSQGQGQGTLRKVAHFMEFASLGFILFRCLLYSRKKWMRSALPVMLGVLAAALDETIQLFSPGRGAQLRDVGIDSGGVITGVLIAVFFFRLFRKKTCPLPKH